MPLITWFRTPPSGLRYNLVGTLSETEESNGIIIECRSQLISYTPATPDPDGQMRLFDLEEEMIVNVHVGTVPARNVARLQEGWQEAELTWKMPFSVSGAVVAPSEKNTPTSDVPSVE